MAPVKKAQPKKKVTVKKVKAVKKSPKKKVVSKSAPKKVQKKLKAAKKETFAKVNPISLPRSVSLATLGAILIPSNPDQIAISTARYAGTFFVFVGALFAFIGINQMNASVTLFDDVRQIATATCSDIYNPDIDPPECEGTQQMQTIDCTNPEFYEHPECAGTAQGEGVETEPSVTFSVMSEDPLNGMVSLRFSVPNAVEVTAMVFEAETQTYHSLGFADQMGENVWKYYWDTMQYANGDYVLKAMVTNDFGTYDNVDTVTHVVLNQTLVNDPPPPPAGDTTSTTTQEIATTTDTDQTDLSPEPEIRIEINEDEPLSGDARVQVFVEGAERVRLFARHTDSRTDFNFGYIDRVGGGEWKYIWDTTQYVNGNYKIHTIAIVDGAMHDFGPYNISVFNELPPDMVPEAEPVDEQTAEEEPEPEAEDLEPDIYLEILETSPVHGGVRINIEVLGAEFIELYAKPHNSLTEYFLGRAVRKDAGVWELRWDTLDLPNNEYRIFARVKNRFGLYYSSKVDITVFNEPVVDHSEDEIQYIEDAQETQTYVEDDTEIGTSDDDFIESVFVESEDSDSNVEFYGNKILQSEVEAILDNFREGLKNELDLFARAVRYDDVNKIQESKERILALRMRVVESVSVLNDSDELLEKIDQHIEDVIRALEDRTVRNEEIIMERSGEAVFADSDSDGVSDYDEINLYETDPFNPDSDNDGFSDGTEILGGYDPINSESEALVVYESPQEVGVVNDDVFVVESIETAQSDDEARVSSIAAVITGKGLPNSFVTLYIFSTPIVVTVKTGDDGSWSYTFDKELEDGEHEVYVGVTDNAGRIVAKSNPHLFIKTAEAFTSVDAASSAAITSSSAQGPSLFSGSIMMVAMSLVVVMLGLVLILLGMHMRSRQNLVAIQ